MEAATMVKYGDILRRFSGKVVDAGLDLSMRLLTDKIFSLLDSRETFEKLWIESKDSDWSRVETVVKVIPSIQNIKWSDEVLAASSNSTKKSPRRVYIVSGIRKKLVQRNRYGNIKFELEEE